MASARADLAIYSPFAGSYYEREAPQGGGAELQLTKLAGALSARGERVAQIVLPVADPIVGPIASPRLVQRRPYRRDKVGRALEGPAIWGALRAANADVYLVRGSSVNVAVIAAFAAVHRRGLIFSAANDFDLQPTPIHDSRRKHDIYIRALRRADAIVVQGERQRQLAERLARATQEVLFIPSFSEEVEPSSTPPRQFLWVSRLAEYKQPLEYLRLAREMPEARFTMVATSGVEDDSSLRAQLEREAASLDNVELLGTLRRDDLMTKIAESVAIVSTSTWEGMPNVFLEAWARSVPALTLSFDPDGLIAGRGLGISAEGSWEEFVAGARLLWGDADARRRLGGNGQAYIRERHAPETIAGAWEEVILRVARR